MNRRTYLYVGLVALAVVVALPASAAQGDNNRGTVKIHDDLVTEPDERNQPHVSCDFWVQGFNFKDSSGYLVFYSWPPTGDKSEVTPTGDTLNWTGVPDGDGEFDFLKGPYQLPEGHYRLEVFTYDGHPRHADGHFAKSKMFWVDPCEPEPPCVDNPETEVDECEEEPPCVDNPETEVDECNPEPPCVDDPQTEVDECGTEIPFFPTTGGLVVGVLGAAGSVGAVLLRRRG